MLLKQPISQTVPEIMGHLDVFSDDVSIYDTIDMRDYLQRNNNYIYLLCHISDLNERAVITDKLALTYRHDLDYNPFKYDLKVANDICSNRIQFDDQILRQKIAYDALKYKEERAINICVRQGYITNQLHQTNLMRLVLVIKLSLQIADIPFEIWAMCAFAVIKNDTRYMNYHNIHICDLQNVIEHMFNTMYPKDKEQQAI